MTSQQSQTDELVPFFTDDRTITEKLVAEERKWMPTKPEENCPDLIAGVVLERDYYNSDYSDEPIPTVRILDHDHVVWSVIAFHGYLRTELEQKNPRVGDYAAVAYRGKLPAKRDGMSDAHDYRVVVERNPDRPQEPSVDHEREEDEAAAVAESEENDGIPF